MELASYVFACSRRHPGPDNDDDTPTNFKQIVVRDRDDSRDMSGRASLFHICVSSLIFSGSTSLFLRLLRSCSMPIMGATLFRMYKEAMLLWSRTAYAQDLDSCSILAPQPLCYRRMMGVAASRIKIWFPNLSCLVLAIWYLDATWLEEMRRRIATKGLSSNTNQASRADMTVPYHDKTW